MFIYLFVGAFINISIRKAWKVNHDGEFFMIGSPFCEFKQRIRVMAQ